jgi:hypothetical protein
MEFVAISLWSHDLFVSKRLPNFGRLLRVHQRLPRYGILVCRVRAVHQAIVLNLPSRIVDRAQAADAVSVRHEDRARRYIVRRPVRTGRRQTQCSQGASEINNPAQNGRHRARRRNKALVEDTGPDGLTLRSGFFVLWHLQFPQGKDFCTRNTAALNFVPVLGFDDETILKDLRAILLTGIAAPEQR